MPKIFADQHAHPAEARVKRLHPVPEREEASFIKHAVGGQIDFAMNMDYLALREVRSRYKKPVADILFHKADGNVDITAGFEQGAEGGIFHRGMAGDRRCQILKRISGERELRKNDQFRALLLRLANVGQMLLNIGGDVAEFGRNLSHGKVEVHATNDTTPAAVDELPGYTERVRAEEDGARFWDMGCVEAVHR
jgi:hypothetical protein